MPAVDLAEAFEISKKATEVFQELPSAVREHCDGDPVKFFAFVQDPANAEKMKEFGLVESPPEAVKLPPLEEKVSEETNPAE